MSFIKEWKIDKKSYTFLIIKKVYNLFDIFINPAIIWLWMFLIFVWLYINLLHYICYWEYLDVQYNVQLNVFIFFKCWVFNKCPI